MSFPTFLFPSQDLSVFNIHEEPEAGLRCKYVNSPHKVIGSPCEEEYTLRKQKCSVCVGGLNKYFRDSESSLFKEDKKLDVAK